MFQFVKIWFFVLFTAVAMIVLGNWVADRWGLMLGWALAISLVSFIYFYGRVRTLRGCPWFELEGQDAWGLLDIVAELAREAKISPPRVYVIDLPTALSCSLGRSWGRSTIAISRGLLERMPREDVRAVVAFELARLHAHDSFSLGLAIAVAGALMFPSRLTERLSKLKSLRGGLNFLHRWVCLVTSHLANISVSPIITRGDFFQVDQSASAYLQSPQKLAEVLWKLDSLSQTSPFALNPALAHLFIVNPLTKQSFFRYFRRQPRVEKRIERLVGYFPI